jgi:hypothetical protein
MVQNKNSAKCECVEALPISSWVQEIIEKGEPWADNEFKADLSSLLDSDPRNYTGRLDEGEITKWKTFGWKRASEIYGDKV